MPTPISSPSDPRIADYTGLRDAHTREQHLTISDAAPAHFIAEGDLVIRQLIDSGLTIRSMLATPQRLAAISDALAKLPPSTPIFTADQPVLNAITGFNIHRGLLASGQRPPPPPLNSLLASARSLIILEDLSNHDNIGGIFRAVAALAGLPPTSCPLPPASCPAAVLLSPRCADPLYRKSIRVSMGHALRIPFARLDPWPDSLAQIRAAGFALCALTPNPSATPIDSLPHIITSSLHHPLRPALLLGAEGPGLSPAALAAADHRVRIPIHIDSLNVVTAAAIALHRFRTPS